MVLLENTALVLMALMPLQLDTATALTALMAIKVNMVFALIIMLGLLQYFFLLSSLQPLQRLQYLLALMIAICTFSGQFRHIWDTAEVWWN